MAARIHFAVERVHVHLDMLVNLGSDAKILSISQTLLCDLSISSRSFPRR